MLRRPLTSTLFPYTTLFRSKFGYVNRFHFFSFNSTLFASSEFPVARCNSAIALLSSVRARNSLLLAADRTVCRSDRKSTRLNSSHMSISYAVFCLKKKNHPHASRQGAPVNCCFPPSRPAHALGYRPDCPRCLHFTSWFLLGLRYRLPARHHYQVCL